MNHTSERPSSRNPTLRLCSVFDDYRNDYGKKIMDLVNFSTIVVLSLGTNDICKNGDSLAIVSAHFNYVIEEIRAKVAKVILVAPPPGNEEGKLTNLERSNLLNWNKYVENYASGNTDLEIVKTSDYMRRRVHLVDDVT